MKRLCLITGLVSTLTIAQPIIQISIPKCGTHLAQKCLSLLFNEPIKNYLFHAYYKPSMKEFNHILHSIDNRDFFFAHMMYNPLYANMLQSRGYPIFFIYRDPRDQLISFIFYMKKRTAEYPKIITTSLNDAIFDLIYTNDLARHKNQAGGIFDFYQSYLPWMTVKNICTIKFENLIGVEGGGTLKAQQQEIRKMAHHLNIELSEEHLDFIIKNLFGNTATFREGQIGSWKKYFSEEHKKAFKKVAGQLLIDLGYEQDLNW